MLADEQRVLQVLNELISNAIKFSHDGGQVEIHAWEAGDSAVMIEVRDYGIGMSADEAVRALQPFSQASSVTARTYGGTGLGLPIAKGLVEAHRGTLRIDSSPGRGTAVCVTLPRRPMRPAPLGSPAVDAGDAGTLQTAERHERAA